MKNKKAILLPKNQEILATVGEQIKLARLRRKLSGKWSQKGQALGGIHLFQLNRAKHRLV
ncbi:MAG: hypothetical protein ACQETL_08525 [Bacteroidota bacterium]